MNSPLTSNRNKKICLLRQRIKAKVTEINFAAKKTPFAITDLNISAIFSRMPSVEENRGGEGSKKRCQFN